MPMRLIRSRFPLLMGAALLLGQPTFAAPGQGELLRSVQKAPVAMRGFGKVAVEGAEWKTPAGTTSRLAFVCETPELATVAASKYLADMLAYGAVATADPLPGLGGTIVSVRHGGEWLLATSGDRAELLHAPTRAALTALATELGAANWTAAPANAYPRYLDNFDNAGLGIWWMPDSKSEEQIAWMTDFPAAVNLHQQRLASSPAAGVIDMAGTANALAQVHAMNKPYRHMLWSGQPEWREGLQMPGDRLENTPAGFIGRRFFEARGYNMEQVASADVNAIQEGTMIQMMRQRMADPDLMAWMEPHGEFHLSDPMLLSPDHQTRFPAWLQIVKGYSLATLSEAYTGDRQYWKSWKDVPFRDGAWFAGRRGHVVDLDDQLWRWKGDPMLEGDAAGWGAPDFDDSSWNQNRRDDRVMLGQWNNSRIRPTWFRFSTELPKDYLTTVDGPVYIHIMPYTEHVGGELSVWVNGQQVCKNLRDKSDHINRHTQVDVTAALRPGKNDFAIYSNGGRISYRVFLSDVPGESFPFTDARMNRIFLDHRDFFIWEKLQTLTEYLKVMRAVDPNRPIKVMTPHLFQAEAMDLFKRFGAYPQLTGEGGSWYRPMHYKGYSRLHGIPGSSEPGGPTKTAKDTQAMFANILWESQDCHDYVFDLNRDLWPYKEVLEWWTTHKPELRTIGKTDFIEPEVGVLRDVRQDQRYSNGAIWNWDLSRGPLPALGKTPVLIDGLDMEQGLANDVPVVLDCATVIMEPAMVDAIHRYVAAGGTFIAQHHTGQHTPTQQDAWPLARSFGLQVENRYKNQDNPHTWPLASIHFTKEQTLFPSLQGKTCEGSGVAIDWKDNEYSGAISIKAKGDHVTPVASWDDGSLAVVEVREGHGRFILVGTPFMTRFKDEAGKWFNERDRQALLAELLAGVGVHRDTEVSAPEVWLERRASKNGLYDVYFASAAGIRDKGQALVDLVNSTLSAERASAAAIVEASAEGIPDVATTWREGVLSLGEQTFQPYQVRQFAAVRDDVGIEGPLHWLGVQAKAWRALEPVPSSLADSILAEAARIAADEGEAGMNLNEGWRVRLNPDNVEDSAWATAPIASLADAPWQDGGMGSWLSRGYPADVVCAQYRQVFTLPADFRRDGSRYLLGMTSWYTMGIHDRGRLWINGKLVENDVRGLFALDVTPYITGDTLDLALQVEAKGVHPGPTGTLFLRRTPAPTSSVSLDQQVVKLTGWGMAGEGVALPLKDSKVFGLRFDVDVPAEWAGHPVRLVIERIPGTGGRNLEGAIVNRQGYFCSENWEPNGPRLDRWLVPGQTNSVELYGAGFMSESYEGGSLALQTLRLEVFPKPKGE